MRRPPGGKHRSSGDLGPSPGDAFRRTNEVMRQRTDLPEQLDVDVTTRGRLPGAQDYARQKIGALGRFTHEPVLHARVKLTERHDPAMTRPVIAQANLDVNGRLVRAQVEAGTAREAIDRLEERLRRRLERIAEHWEARRGKSSTAGAHQWRRQSEPTHRPSYFPRPEDERQVIRRKAFTLTSATVDEAAAELEMLDYDFHLFTEKGTGQDGVLYRGGPSGYRLAQAKPTPVDQLAPFTVGLAVSPQPAPRLSVEQAAERLGLIGLPFLFFVDTAQDRGSVLYHRYDGHYGLITPVA